MRTLLYPSGLLVLFLLSLSVASAHGQPVDTFRVTTESQEPEHPYYQEGFPTKFAIDGAQNTNLILQKGEEYLFQMDGVESFHPFYISTSAVGGGGETYDNGVTGNGASDNEQLTFTPPAGAPDSLWYQCTNHEKMGWRMALVVDSSRAPVSSDGAVVFSGTGVTINFSGTSGSDQVTVDKFNSAPDGREGINESTVSQYRFAIEAGSDVSFDANTDVRFDVSTLSGIGDASNVTVYRRSTVGSGSFAALSTSYESDANELVVTTNEFGEFVFASDSEPLPVEIAAFEARVDGPAVHLTWQTVSETGSAGFEVQRRVIRPSSESAVWTARGFVESKVSGGTTTEPVRYRFRDELVPFEASRIAYRLRQVDRDGASSLSRAVTVRIEAPSRVALHAPFPNPTAGPTMIHYALPRTAEVRLALYNMLGKRVATLIRDRQPSGRKEVPYDASELASGTYVLRLRAGEQVQTRQLTVLR